MYNYPLAPNLLPLAPKIPVLMMYIKPTLRIEEAQVANMLAESLVIDNTTTVDGSDALTRENDFDIWDDEE